MPLLRGTIHELVNAPVAEPGAVGLAVFTNDRWNSAMSQVGAALVRPEILPVEAQYAVQLRDGRFATAARVVSLIAPLAAGGAPSPFGPAQGALTSAELAQLEDAFVRFLQLPLLLVPAPRPRRPLGNPAEYPNWGDLHYGNELIEGERKRFIVVSPNEWNAATGLASALRTTSRFRADVAQFPRIQGGRVHACCGDLSTFGPGELLLRRGSRPTPATCTLPELIAIARGVVATHDLAAAVGRAGL